jgi:hypothetical protein
MTVKEGITQGISEFLFDKSMPIGLKNCRVFIMEGEDSEGIVELNKSEVLAELTEIVEHQMEDKNEVQV